MSGELQWLLIRNTSSFLQRRKHGKKVTFSTVSGKHWPTACEKRLRPLRFSKEPNNLKGTNSYKYNALVNKKVLVWTFSCVQCCKTLDSTIGSGSCCCARQQRSRSVHKKEDRSACVCGLKARVLITVQPAYLQPRESRLLCSTAPLFAATSGTQIK